MPVAWRHLENPTCLLTTAGAGQRLLTGVHRGGHRSRNPWNLDDSGCMPAAVRCDFQQPYWGLKRRAVDRWRKARDSQAGNCTVWRSARSVGVHA